jgi:hypothetical protein
MKTAASIENQTRCRMKGLSDVLIPTISFLLLDGVFNKSIRGATIIAMPVSIYLFSGLVTREMVS